MGGFKGIDRASSKGPPPTEAQLTYLYELCDKYGTTHDVRRVDALLTIQDASDMIEEMKDRREFWDDDRR